MAEKLQRQILLPFGALRWLITDERSTWYYLTFQGSEHDPRAFWNRHRDAVVKHCAKRQPGHRPPLWWRFTAPEMRKRLGGIGTPLFECSAYSPTHCYGVPEFWRIPNNDYVVRGTHISEVDPPCYESSAAYLQRLGLLLPGEKRRISRHDFLPNYIRNRDERIVICRA